MSKTQSPDSQENFCGEYPVFTPTERKIPSTQTKACSCGKRFFRSKTTDKCLNCREIVVSSLDLLTRAHREHNAFLVQLSEDTLTHLEKLNTRHNDLTKHDKANTARLAWDTLIEDRYVREHGQSSPMAYLLRARFRAWLNAQLDGAFHMPFALYFADARIVLGVQLGEHTHQQLENRFRCLGL